MSRVPPSFSLFPYTTLFRSIDGVFAAAVDFGVTFLPAKAFHFGHGHAFNTELGQGFLDLLELERFDDRFQFFHVELIALAFASFEAERSTRSLTNAMLRLQTRNFRNRARKFFARFCAASCHPDSRGGGMRDLTKAR